MRNGSLKRNVAAGSEIVSNNGDFLYEMVPADAGIAVLPEFIVRDGLNNGLVEQALPRWSASPLWLSLYYPPYEFFPPLVATFTDFFEANLSGVAGFEIDARSAVDRLGES